MKKILVVDDEEILRMLITDTLEDEGYSIIEAEDGEQALYLIEKDKFDLVILDFMMPGLTGIEVAEQICEEKKQKTQLLMLTAKTQTNDIEESERAGIQYFMGKPFSPAELLMLVKEILE